MNIRCKSALWLCGLLLSCGVAAGQEAEPVSGPEVQRSQDTVVFRFASDNRMFWMEYKGNADAIEALSRQIQDNRADIAAGTVKVRVLGFCTS